MSASIVKFPGRDGNERVDRHFWLPSLRRTPGWVALSPWARWGRWAFVLSLIAAAPMVWLRSIRNGGTDFYEYYLAGRHVVEHGTRQPDSILYYYWPSLDVAWAGLCWMPIGYAAAVWYAIGCLSWIGLLNAVGRYLLAELDERERNRALLATGLLMMPIAILHACLGAFHVLMLWWMVAGIGRVSQGRRLSGGVLLGLAVWIKLLPLMGVGYLVLKRQWKPALIAVATALAVDVALSVGGLGLRATWDEHRQWWQEEATSATRRVLANTDFQIEHRFKNQSLAMVMRRVLTPVVCDPGRSPDRIGWGDLSTRQVTILYYATAGLIGLGILAVSRRAAWATWPDQWGSEIALLALATLWFSPVAWSYHNTAVAPALAAILGRRQRHPWIAWLIVGLWALGMASFGVRLARGLGVTLWLSLLMGALLVGTTRRADPATEQEEAKDDRQVLRRAA